MESKPHAVRWQGAGDVAAPRVIVAEDEEGSRTAMCELLRDGGYDAVGVSDGLALLERVTGMLPAAVVLDLAMPRLNGMEVAAALRSHPATRDVAIIAVTASWLAEREDLLAAAGFDAGLRKPFSAETLLDALRRALVEDDERAEEGTAAEGRSPRLVTHERRAQ